MIRWLLKLATISIFLCLFLESAVQAQIDPKSFVGIWLFDEGVGDIVKDFSGKGHDGKITGAKWVNGKFGKALEFDGQSSVSIPSTADLQIGEQLTMLAWFFARNISDSRGSEIFSKVDEYLLRIDPPGEGSKMSAFVKPGGNWEPRATSAFAPNLGTWIHLAAVYNSRLGSDQLKIFVNGELSGSSTRPPGTVAKTDNPLGLGNFFGGLIDEVAILNVALTADQVRSTMSGLRNIISAAVAQVSPITPTTIEQGWSAVKNISRDNAVSDKPAIAADASGGLYVVWEDNRYGDWEILYSQRIGTSWSAPLNISNNAGDSRNPTITVDASPITGSSNIYVAHVVWEDNTSGNMEILYSQWTVPGWSAPLNISNNAGDSRNPAIAVDTSGNPHVVWEDNTSGNMEILYSQRIGTSWSAPLNISNSSGISLESAIAVDASGNPHVVWEDNTSGNMEILYSQWTVPGWSAPLNISNTHGDSRNPAIAVDTHTPGNPHVVWQDNAPGNAEILYRRRFGSWSTIISNISNTSGASWDPAVYVLGNPHVVWSEHKPGSPNSEILSRSMMRGTIFTEPGKISFELEVSWSTIISNISNTSGTSWNPTIAVDALGNTHVVWRGDTPGNPEILEFSWMIKLMNTDLSETAGQTKLFKVRADRSVFYKRGGEPSISYKVGGQPFISLPMFDDGAHNDGAANDGTWARELPSSLVTLKGLAVDFTATDTKGYVAGAVPLSDETNIFHDRPANVEVTGNATSPPIPVWNSPADWTMISFPVSLPNANSAAVFGGLGIARTNWKAYQYNGGADYDTTFSMAPGRAAWIWHDGKLPDGTVGAKTVTVTGAKSMDLTKVFAIRVNPGWNQIGNPFWFNILWNNTVKFSTTGRDADAVDILTAAANDKIANPPIIYLKSATGYTRISAEATPSLGTISGVLEPWKGYWFLAKTGGLLFIDPNQAIPDPFELPENPIPLAPAYEPIAYKGWMLELNTNGLAINAGMSQDAADALDRLDLISPPPPANDIRFAFAHPEWNDKWAVYYDQDIRAMNQDSAIWEIDLKSDSKPVTITWKQLYEIPNEYMLMLIDLSTGTNVDMRKETSYTITGEGERKLYFVASIGGKGIPEFLAKLIIKKTELMQNFPNPFNPETWIPYKLANEADVSIRIFDISGRLVRTLRLGRKDIGLYISKERAAYWDGKNEHGERVSSGIYFYQLQAGKVSFVRKMVILK